MDGMLLQDWVTIRGDSGTAGGGPKVTSIAQSAEGWIDLGDVEDLVFFLDVREFTNASLKLGYETSPIKQDGSFLPMVGPFLVAVGQRVDRAFSTTCAVPPARFIRWRLSGPSMSNVFDVTFRIWVATYAWRKAWR